MTKRQAEILLGGPPRWEVKPRSRPFIDPGDLCRMQFRSEQWWGREGIVEIWYQDGFISDMEFSEHRCDVVPLDFRDLPPFSFFWPCSRIVL